MRTRGTIIALLFSLSLMAGHAADQSDVTTVLGTNWVGTDSEGDYYEYYFMSNGSLHYKSRNGFWKNGTWKQDGNTIYMEQNSKFSEYEGTIHGNTMEGKAWNIKGHHWTWSVKKQ